MRGNLSRRVVALGASVILAGGFVAANQVSPPAAQAALTSISNDPVVLGQMLVDYHNRGLLTTYCTVDADSARPCAADIGGINAIYQQEILPLSQGHVPAPGAPCSVDVRILQLLVLVIDHFQQTVDVTDIERYCIGSQLSIRQHGAQNGHGGWAIDIDSIGGASVNGSTQKDAELLAYLYSIKPTGGTLHVGQTQCANHVNYGGFSNFEDSCTHQHVDFSSATTGLNVPSTPAQPTFPILSSGWTVAYKNAGGSLSTENSNLQISNWGFVTAANTSPSIAYLPNGKWEAAFIGSGGTFYTFNSDGQVQNWGFAVAPNTSPSIAALENGKWVAAFVGSAGLTYTVDSDGNVENLGHAMKAGTSPSISALPGNNWVMAFQTAGGTLAAENNSLQLSNYGIAMAGSSSPSVAGLTDGRFEIAFVGSNNLLYVIDGALNLSNFGHSIRPGTSPSIQALPNNKFVVAYQNDNCTVSTETSDLQIQNYGICMTGNSSPSVTATTSGSWYTAFVGSNNVLYQIDSAVNLENLGHAIASNTSPAIG